MKKIMFLLCLLGFFTTATAQYNTQKGFSTPSKGSWASATLPYYTSGDDTASGADVIRMGGYLKGKYDINITTTVTKVSGTIATTSFLVVRASADGVNWWTLNEGQTISYKDTTFMANATTTATWSFTADEVNAEFIEVYYSQATGTSPVTAPVTTLYYRKHEE